MNHEQPILTVHLKICHFLKSYKYELIPLENKNESVLEAQ